MSIKHAALGLYHKGDKKNKVYYVNRQNFGFSIKKLGEDGKPIMRTNTATGMPITDAQGNPIFIEESVMFTQWVERFNELGYWCVYEVTKNTSKTIADELERMSKSKNHQVMNEKAFIEFSNPVLSEHMKETEGREEELAQLDNDISAKKKEKSALEEEIAKLKKKAGV